MHQTALDDLFGVDVLGVATDDVAHFPDPGNHVRRRVLEPFHHRPPLWGVAHEFAAQNISDLNLYLGKMFN